MMDIALAKEANEALKGTTMFQRIRMKRWGKKFYIGHEQREGWRGQLPLFLFWCDECDHYAKDSPHGDGALLYLSCAYCGKRQYFIPWWVPFAFILHALYHLGDLLLRKKEKK